MLVVLVCHCRKCARISIQLCAEMWLLLSIVVMVYNDVAIGVITVAIIGDTFRGSLSRHHRWAYKFDWLPDVCFFNNMHTVLFEPDDCIALQTSLYQGSFFVRHRYMAVLQRLRPALLCCLLTFAWDVLPKPLLVRPHLYPYGPKAGDATLTLSEGAYSNLFPLSTPFKFFDESHSSLVVSNVYKTMLPTCKN